MSEKVSFKNAAAEFVYVRTYSRWKDDLKRRETWEETVDRYISFMREERGDKVPEKVFRKIKEGMMNFDVMPSMRSFWAAGDAAKKDNCVMYNCSYLDIDSIESFAECLYILMCGTGVGFGVSAEVVDKLPCVPRQTSNGEGVHTIDDSREGWADSLKALMSALYRGNDVQFDYSKIRPLGSRLKTMGGRASGPQPLIDLHNFVRYVFNTAAGRKLRTIECHDICNKIAEIVVVGGVRRSSQISLSDLNDSSMREAKTGNFPVYRYMANNSAKYIEKPSAVEFLKEWSALASSGSGERGIFNLGAARLKSPERRDVTQISGTNPCGEILLRDAQFCNLSEVVMRSDDDLDSLLEKVETATWIGVIQSSFTNFPYLREKWRVNCDEERLLGVSVTGQLDAPHLLTDDNLKAMKSRAIKVAKKASAAMGINMSAAITCTKPSGTVSQVVDCASGMHPRYSNFYIRRYRISASDPLFKMMRAQGFKFTPENGQSKADWEAAFVAELSGANHHNVCSIYKSGEEWSESKVTTWVVAFPIKAPNGSVTREAVSAIDQLEHYKKLMKNWAEHNCSLTVYVRKDEWLKVGDWVYSNWDTVSGISFLPYEDSLHVYKQAPYEEISEAQYKKMVSSFKEIDYSRLSFYELEDGTAAEKSFACSGDKCEIAS
jgi:ribonucleoside-diphosphate reductase alpha chain